MASRRQRRFASQAALETLVRFGPELDGLMALMREAQGARRSTIRSARSSARSTSRAVERARPTVHNIYDRAGLEAARAAHTFVGQDLAALPGVANSIKAGAGLEQSAAAARLEGAQAAALSDLSSRKVAAREGAQFAVQRANQDFRSDMGKIQERRQGILEESGAFEALTLGRKQDEAAARALTNRISLRSITQSERNSIRSSGIDPDTGAPIPGGRLDPNRKPSNRGRRTASGAEALTKDKHLEWATDIDEIVNRAGKIKGTRREIVDKLVSGRPQQSFYIVTDAKGKVILDAAGNPRIATEAERKLGNVVKKTLPTIPSYPRDLRMRAALDVALDGHLSKRTQKLLQDAGFIISELGLPTYGEWQRNRRKAYDKAYGHRPHDSQQR